MRLEIRGDSETGLVHGRGVEILLNGTRLRHVTRAVLVIDVNDAVRLYTGQLVAPTVDVAGEVLVEPLPDGFDPEAEVRR